MTIKILSGKKRCVIMPLLSYRYLATGGGVHVDGVISFIVSVVAGIIAYYICKWLDSKLKHKDNE